MKLLSQKAVTRSRCEKSAVMLVLASLFFFKLRSPFSDNLPYDSLRVKQKIDNRRICSRGCGEVYLLIPNPQKIPLTGGKYSGWEKPGDGLGKHLFV